MYQWSAQRCKVIRPFNTLVQVYTPLVGAPSLVVQLLYRLHQLTSRNRQLSCSATAAPVDVVAAPEQEVIAIDDYLDALGVPLDYTRALDYFHGRVMQANVSAAGLALAVEALTHMATCSRGVGVTNLLPFK